MAKHPITGLDTEGEADDLILEGVNRIAEYVETNVKAAKDDQAKLRDILDNTKSQMAKLAEKSDKKVDEVAALLNDKIERIARRQNPLGSAALFGEADRIKAAIPEGQRHYITLAESVIASGRGPEGRALVGGRMNEPVFRAATALWLQKAAALQTKAGTQRQAQLRDEIEKIEMAFADAYGKGIDELSEGANPGGGFLVPAPIESEVLRLIADNTVVRPFARKLTMTSKTVNVPQKGNAITAYIGAEEANLTGSYDQTAFASVTLTAKRFHGRATSSIELFEDSIVGLSDYILTTLAEEIGILEDFEALEGSGTNFTGVIAASGVNSVATTTTDGEAMVYGDLARTVWKARQRSSRNSARWFGAPEVFGAAEALVDSQGQPIVRYGAVQDGLVRNLLGFPIEPVSSCSITITRGATGNTANLYFGNPTAILFGDRTGMRFDVSDAPGWANYRLDMRLVKRTAIAIGVPSAFTKLVGIVY